MGPVVTDTNGIPSLTRLCLNKLLVIGAEMCGHQFNCYKLEKLFNACAEKCGHQIISSCVDVNSYTSTGTYWYLYTILQQYISRECNYEPVQDPLWHQIVTVLYATERKIVLNMAAKVCGIVVCVINCCQSSNSFRRPHIGEELKENVCSETTECLQKLDRASEQGSSDNSPRSLSASEDLSVYCKSCTNQNENEVVTSESVAVDKKISKNENEMTQNENEVSMFDFLFLDSFKKKLNNKQDMLTSNVLLDRKQCGKEIGNVVTIVEVDSLDNKKYEAEADIVIAYNMNVDIQQLKKKTIFNDVSQKTIFDDVSRKAIFDDVSLFQTLKNIYSERIKSETLGKSASENEHKISENIDAQVYSYESSNSDRKKSLMTIQYGFRCNMGLSSRLHDAVPYIQKQCHLYCTLQVSSSGNYFSQLLICAFKQESDSWCYIINFGRVKERDIARINISRFNRVDIKQISTTDITRVKIINMARMKGIDFARIKSTETAENRDLIMHDNRVTAIVLLLGINDLHKSQKQLPSWPLANQNNALSCPASLLLPDNAAKTVVTRLGKQSNMDHKKNACRVNSCQKVSSSSESVTCTTKTSEHNHVKESSPVCKFGSNLQRKFHAKKPNAENAQMYSNNSDRIVLSIKPQSGKGFSVLMKSEHVKNPERRRNSSSSDVLDSVRLKKLQFQVHVEMSYYFEPGQALRNVCVNMVPQSVCGIPWKEFERETMRLASFAKYPASAAKSPANLASCGFVYVGNGMNDRVKCYFCSAEKESWEMNDNIDDVHKSLSPSCPMVIVQFSNNVSSNTSPVFSSAVGFSSSVPYGAESLRSMATATRSANFAYDDVDYHRTDDGRQPAAETATRQSSSSQETAVTLFLPAHTNGSINPPGSPTNTPLYSRQGRLQEEPTTAAGNNVVNHGNSRNSGNLSEESIRTLQNNSNTNPDNVSHHPNINEQVYAIPPVSNGSTVADNSAQSATHLTYQLLGIFHERPKFPNYAVLARRLQSFDGWPENHPISKEDLVKSGLFFAGYGDCCKCFFCGGGLRNWENGDNAYVEHARWFEKCSYIRQFMGLEFVEAVQSLKSRGGTITFKDVTDYMKAKGQSIQNLFSDRKISDDMAVKSLVDAGYNEEAVSAAALSLRQNGELLSADVILRKIREQHPEVSGAASAEAVTDDRTHSEDAPDEERLQALKEQNYALRSNLTCKICMDKEVRIVFLPCGHLISCQECAVALQDCPLCRSHIRARARANIN